MLQDMKYIYQIYKYGNLSKAAESLFLTQPALSMALKKIEKSLGRALFDKTERPFRLTEAGKIYIQAIEKMIRLEADLDQKLHDLNCRETGSLRIGGSHYINSYILPPLLSILMRRTKIG